MQFMVVVGTGALDIAFAVLDAAPEVTAADDNANLHAHFDALADHLGHAAHHIKIQTKLLVACQRFAADLQQDALIFGCVHDRILHYF